MGDLKGHVLTGTFQIIVGIWWMYSALRRHFLVKHLQNPNYKYKNTVTYPIPCKPNVFVEPWVKIIFSLAAVAMEFGTGVMVGPGLVPGWAIQHAMANAFFTLSGVVDLMVRKYPSVLPKYTDYAALAFAVYMKYWIFSNHKHGKGPLENMIHGFLLPLDQGVILALAFEVFCNEYVLPALMRGFMTTIAGSWLIQIGFTLFPPSGIIVFDENDHNDMMQIVGIFAVHCFGCVPLLLVLIFKTNCSVLKWVHRQGSHINPSTVDFVADNDVEHEPETKFNKHP